MADVREASGVFSLQARRQYGAVAAMRWQMLRNSLRTRRGNFELGARIFATTFFALIGLGAGVGLGFAAYGIASGASLRLLPVLFWPVFLLWQILPVMVVSFQQHVDLSSFLRFPLSFGSYMLITLIFGLADPASIVCFICLYGIWTGLVVAEPHAVVGITLAILLFAVFNLLLTRMIFSWIDRWLAQRRTREIMGMVLLFLLLSVQLIGPLTQHYKGRLPLIDWKILSAVGRWQSFLPPGVAATAVRHSLTGNHARAVPPMGSLALYGLAAGVLLGVRLHAEYRGENLGESAQRSPAKPRQSAARGLPRDISRNISEDNSGRAGPVGAVIEKELRYLSRSGVMLYSLVAPLVMLMVFAGGGRSGPSIFSIGRYALPMGIVYSFLGLTRLIYNALGGEGEGIQLYFTAPVPFRKIMLSKNLVQLTLLCLELVPVCLIVRLRFGMPDPGLIAATACWLLFALPLQLAAGNLMSLLMPYRMTLSRMSREQGSVGNGLTSIVIQVIVAAVGAIVFLPLSRHGHEGTAAIVFLVLALGSMALWLRVYLNMDRMASQRKEDLMRRLRPTG
jgi:ABC-2 type transport system permease protein